MNIVITLILSLIFMITMVGIFLNELFKREHTQVCVK